MMVTSAAPHFTSNFSKVDPDDAVYHDGHLGSVHFTPATKFSLRAG